MTDNFDRAINFMDSADGVQFWRKCEKIDRQIWTGCVRIKVMYPENGNFRVNSFYQFLEKLFAPAIISPEQYSGDAYLAPDLGMKIHVFTVIADHMTGKKDIQALLDHSVILNTYSENYFKTEYGTDMRIYCGVKCYESEESMQYESMKYDMTCSQINFRYPLAVNELVRINTDAEQNLAHVRTDYDGFYPYDYTFTKLEKNLATQFY